MFHISMNAYQHVSMYSTVSSMAYLHVKLSDFYDLPMGSISGNDPPPSTVGSDTMACRIYVVEFDVR
jgi:hypothetical protein